MIELLTNLFGGKKKFIIAGGFILILLTLLSRGLSVTYWNDINWDMSSHHPWLPMLGILWALFYMAILYVKKVHVTSLWIIGAIGMGYSIIMFWAMYLRV